MKLETDIKDNAELREKVVHMACTNHIWINAFTLVRPTDETYRDIGKTVVDMLKQRENLLPSYYGAEVTGPLTEMQKMTPVLYMCVNQS